MKRIAILLTLLVLAASGTATAQTKNQSPNGYETLADYRAGKPKTPYLFYADKRSATLMKVSPGNDYKVECNDASIKKDYITDQLWGVEWKDTLYVNCKRFSGLDWFAKAEVMGRYVFMNIAAPINPKYKTEIGDWANSPASKAGSMPNIPGLIGGAMTSAVERLLMRIPVIYDTEKDAMRCITTDLLYQYSQQYPQLKDKYGLVKIETLSTYAFREFAQALNEADKAAKEAEMAAANAAAEAAATEAAAAEAAPADSAPAQAPEPADPNKTPIQIQIVIPAQIPSE